MPGVWEVYAEVQHWPMAGVEPFVSRGHQPEQAVELRVNTVARASYLGLVTDTIFPEGSVLVELSRGNGPGYAMQKVRGAWRYVELDGQGRVLSSTSRGPCADCHAQAAADHVFGPAREP